MLINSGLFVFLLTALEVSARHKALIVNAIQNEINSEFTPSSSRIMSGWEARPGEIPHHVALRTVKHDGLLFRCGGAIISKEWIITAALGLRNTRSVIARFGLSFNFPDFFIDAAEWHTHPSYNMESDAVQPNDIALAKLSRPIVYTNLVKAIRVQPSADAYRDYDGEQAYVSGHGTTSSTAAVTDGLRWVYVRGVSNSDCGIRLQPGLVVATTICANYYNVTTQGPCLGDGGAPLVHVGSDGVPTLIGIFSFLTRRENQVEVCGTGLPYGYTRPGPYLPWFKEVTGIDYDNLQEDPTSTTTSTPAPTTLPTPSTTVTTPATTDSADQEPEYSTPDDTITTPDGSGEGDDSDNTESDQDDDVAQLLKRLQVLVKVKVRMDKFNTTKAVGMEVDQKH